MPRSARCSKVRRVGCMLVVASKVLNSPQEVFVLTTPPIVAASLQGVIVKHRHSRGKALWTRPRSSMTPGADSGQSIFDTAKPGARVYSSVRAAFSTAPALYPSVRALRYALTRHYTDPFRLELHRRLSLLLVIRTKFVRPTVLCSKVRSQSQSSAHKLIGEWILRCERTSRRS